MENGCLITWNSFFGHCSFYKTKNKNNDNIQSSSACKMRFSKLKCFLPVLTNRSAIKHLVSSLFAFKSGQRENFTRLYFNLKDIKTKYDLPRKFFLAINQNHLSLIIIRYLIKVDILKMISVKLKIAAILINISVDFYCTLYLFPNWHFLCSVKFNICSSIWHC